MTSVPKDQQCPECKGTGKIVLLNSTVPCERCKAQGKTRFGKVVFPLIRNPPPPMPSTAYVVAVDLADKAYDKVCEEPNMSFGDYRHALEQTRKVLEESQKDAAAFLRQLHKLAGWFNENAPEVIGKHGGAVDTAIAYMERLRATQDSYTQDSYTTGEEDSQVSAQLSKVSQKTKEEIQREVRRFITRLSRGHFEAFHKSDSTLSQELKDLILSAVHQKLVLIVGPIYASLDTTQASLNSAEQELQHLRKEILHLANWFKKEAPEEIGEDGAVYDAIAYMERLRATQDPCATGEENLQPADAQSSVPQKTQKETKREFSRFLDGLVKTL